MKLPCGVAASVPDPQDHKETPRGGRGDFYSFELFCAFQMFYNDYFTSSKEIKVIKNPTGNVLREVCSCRGAHRPVTSQAGHSLQAGTWGLGDCRRPGTWGLRGQHSGPVCVLSRSPTQSLHTGWHSLRVVCFRNGRNTQFSRCKTTR